MSTKSKKRARARAHAHQQQVRPQRHSRPVVAPKRREPERRGHRLAEAPRRLYAYALAVAVLAGALLIALSQISAREETTAAAPRSGVAVAGIAETAATFDGVPQRGNVLGSPRAPFQLVVYSDLQCGYCAKFASDVLPTIVRDYVRTGKVQMVYRGLAFLGPDSVTALQTTTAAGRQNRLWNVSELLYANQGLENAWVTDDLLRSSVTAAGASATRAFAERDSAYVTATIDRWASMAARDGVQGVPAFYAGRRGGELEPLAIGALTVPEFRAALDSVVT
ncbi:MAG TPA: thioredoxin domain-containing protein [Gaiellaceae bacterium]|nr:thioredoxin domain-containing protein [Gaiellaceae bacterium]